MVDIIALQNQNKKGFAQGITITTRKNNKAYHAITNPAKDISKAGFINLVGKPSSGRTSNNIIERDNDNGK